MRASTLADEADDATARRTATAAAIRTIPVRFMAVPFRMDARSRTTNEKRRPGLRGPGTG
jgi:hypothetical protein